MSTQETNKHESANIILNVLLGLSITFWVIIILGWLILPTEPEQNVHEPVAGLEQPVASHKCNRPHITPEMMELLSDIDSLAKSTVK
jgi:hypothetical protein